MKFLAILFVLSHSLFILVNPLPLGKSQETYYQEDFEVFANKKTIPDEIREITLEALSFFPDLLDVEIDFQFKQRINGSVMQAQPKVFSVIFDNKNTRTYRVKVSRHLPLHGEEMPIEDLPKDVLLGWIGHELGHIMDYLNRSSVDLMHFGARYFCSPRFVTEAEISADSYAVAAGLGSQIIANKEFVLNHELLAEEYKEKIRRLYLSPSQIMTMLDEEDFVEQVN